MRRFAFLMFILSAAVALPGRAEQKQTVRTFTQSFPGEGLATLALDIPVGEVRVLAGNGPDVAVEIRVACGRDRFSSCAERAKKATITAARSGDRIDVRLSKGSGWGHRNLEVRAFVTAPRRLSVKTDLGVGALHIDGFAGDVSADLGVGEVHVTAPEAAVRSVSIDTGIGEEHLIAAGRHWSSEGLFIRDIHWTDGLGQARIAVDLGVGEAHVRLEPGERTAAKR